MSDEYWFAQASFKTPGGTLVNIRATSVDDLKEALDRAEAVDLAGTVLKGDTAYGAAAIIRQGTGPGTHPVQAPPMSNPPQPQQQAPLCGCNRPAKFVPGGINRNRQPYQAFWACDAPRNQQCNFKQSA